MVSLPKKINISGLLEIIVLVSMFGLILYLGYGTLADNKISHDFPFGYMASDAFQHSTRAESIQDIGNYKYEASYLVMGIEDGIGYYPPLLFHLAVILSNTSGVEVYDTIYFLIFFATALSVLIIYFAIKKYNTHVAILSMPLTILLFQQALYAGFTWGHWPSILSQFFVVALIWFAVNINLKYSSVFFIFFLGASIMTHTSEAIIGAMVLFIYLIYLFFTKKFSTKKIIEIAIASVLMLIITFNYLLIFKNIWAYAQPFTFHSEVTWGAPMMFIGDLGLILVIFAISLIYSIISFKKKNQGLFLISISFLILSYGNYIGFSSRAFQIRFFWPIYLAFLFGLGIFFVVKLVYKKWNIIYSFVAALLLIIIILFGNFSFIPQVYRYDLNPNNPGLMTPFHWDIFKWIENETPDDSKVYFFFGDIYDQDASLRNTKRLHHLITREAMNEAINNQEIKRFFKTEPPGAKESLGAKKTSFFKFDVETEEYKDKSKTRDRNICNYDYYIFDKYASITAYAEYNKLIASELLKNDFFSVAHENPYSIILKNDKPGEDCIEERKIE